jgi:hypothetical protein
MKYIKNLMNVQLIRMDISPILIIRTNAPHLKNNIFLKKSTHVGNKINSFQLWWTKKDIPEQ